MYFQKLEENLKKPGRKSKNSKNLEEIQKTQRKFPKSFGHPVFYMYKLLYKNYQVQIRPWNTIHEEYNFDLKEKSGRLTVFVGGVPRPLRAGLIEIYFVKYNCKLL